MLLNQKIKDHLVKIVIFFVATSLAYFLLKQNLDLNQHLVNMNWPLYATSVFTQLAYLYYMMLPMRRLLQEHHTQIPLNRWLLLTAFCNCINLSTPYRMDLLVRYFLLKKWAKLNLVPFSQLTFIYSTISISVGISLLLTLTLLQKKVFQIFDWKALILPILTILAVGLTVFIIKKTKKIPVFLQKVEHQLLSIPNPHNILKWSVLQFSAARLSAFLGFVIVTHAMHFSLPLLFLALLSVALFLSQLFVITPGNIGVTESVLGLITLLFYKDLSLGIQVAFFYRMSALGSSVILSVLFEIWNFKTCKYL